MVMYDKYKSLIKKIQFPETNIYYEKDNADGYGFLGYARSKVGLDTSKCLDKIIERDFSLSIKNSKEASPNNKYVYILWPCAEFLKSIDNNDFENKFISRLNKIGTYPTGEFRYCTDEYYRAIPNATSAAALLYALYGQKDMAASLLQKMEEWQSENGNWKFIFHTKKEIRYEDDFHVSMILYQIYYASKILNINMEDVLSKAGSYLIENSNKNIYKGIIEWGVPMLYVAMECIKNPLSDVLLKPMLNKYIKHKNFRTRAYAAWALIKREEIKCL